MWVSIAQHPGNKRFRSLITTRYDATYCSLFSTSEKQALAKEVIAHIKALDPPGRFLKRTGSSNGSQGLEGPWEELSPKEVLKKTAQALRDCNRSDRSGYAASVDMPEDVKYVAAERVNSGMTLKAHAKACVARATAPSTNIDKAAFDARAKMRSQLARNPKSSADDRKPAAKDSITAEAEAARLMDDSWLKRPPPPQEDIEPLPAFGESTCSPHGTAGALNSRETVRAYSPPIATSMPMVAAQATPIAPPHMAPAPVTNTPIQGGHPYQSQLLVHTGYSPSSQSMPGPLRQPPPPMPPPSGSPVYHEDPLFQAPPAGDHPLTAEEETSVHARMAPFSPVIWGRHNEDGQEDLDDATEPVPMAEWKDEDIQSDDALQTAAHAAAAIINGTSSNPHDFPLLSGDDIPHGCSLDLNQLE
ncbi:MAG: hypothetical protein SGILL_005908 [Bacillariaceae sp.]